MKTTSAKDTSISSAQIATKAYELWERAGRPAGRDIEFWLAAERQLTRAGHSVAEESMSRPASARSALARGVSEGKASGVAAPSAVKGSGGNGRHSKPSAMQADLPISRAAA
jgi:hypothetical protein